jgi:hypothetical protein
LPCCARRLTIRYPRAKPSKRRRAFMPGGWQFGPGRVPVAAESDVVAWRISRSECAALGGAACESPSWTAARAGYSSAGSRACVARVTFPLVRSAIGTARVFTARH